MLGGIAIAIQEEQRGNRAPPPLGRKDKDNIIVEAFLGLADPHDNGELGDLDR